MHKTLPRYPIGNPHRVWRQDNFILSTFSARGDCMRDVIENCAEAGFNLLEMGWATHEQAEEALRLCEGLGIDILFQDFSVFGGMQGNHLDNRVSRETVRRVCDHLRPYRRAYGVYIFDEPYKPEQTAEARRQVDLFQQEAPYLMPFTVAIPSYNDLYRWHDGGFEEYLERYASEIDPPVLSLDYYPVGLREFNDADQLDGSYMWMDLGLMRKICRERQMPLWFYYQGVNLHKYPHFEFPMVRAMMYAAVMYGAKALQQYTAVGSVIEQSGKKGPFFDDVKAIHAEFRNLGGTLMALDNKFVFHSSEIAEKLPPYARFADDMKDSAVLADEPLPARISVGELADAYGNTYLLVLNRDFTKEAAISLPLKKTSRLYKVCPHCGRQFEKGEGQALSLTLAPGDGQLWRVQDAAAEACTIEYRIEK